jgi:hypothetical protein
MMYHRGIYEHSSLAFLLFQLAEKLRRDRRSRKQIATAETKKIFNCRLRLISMKTLEILEATNICIEDGK